ncbi:hypothetical protein TNIN_41141 [Trichonephila inaurata madagascariensis]|uniref:Uncharacterized protein n=1 Tax=Trichonephila inaurata madagascariensis TaxID=2747483 RepID=A0A8X7CL99_9ARAC|nr:hypothetical protein TNIN_41141 [Trichonephila inaurata madagascariensis]
MTMEHQPDMEFAPSTSLTSSRSSTPTLTNCEKLQMVQAELRKFSIMHRDVTHTINSIAPYAPDDDPKLADLYVRQAYLDERKQQAISEYGSLLLAVTPLVVKFSELNENDTDIAGHSQNAVNFHPSTPKLDNNTNNDKANTPSTLPPPVFLKIEKHDMAQLKTLTEIIPTLRSKKTGELIKLYTNNFDDYRLLNNTVEKLKYQFFVIKPKHEKPIKVVIKKDCQGHRNTTNTRELSRATLVTQ